MIFFGHLGITTGAVKAYEKLAYKQEKKSSASIDYRFVLAGSVLPDIIDKPIGAFLFRNTFHNSRIFAHTLIFSVILVVLGMIYYEKKKKLSILLLGASSFIHLILDSMWEYEKILFWPCFGIKFPTRPEGDWIKEDMLHLLSNPVNMLPELIGFIIIAYYFIKLFKNKEVKSFISQGKL